MNTASVSLHWTAPYSRNYYFVFATTSANDVTVVVLIGSTVNSTTSYIQYVTLGSIVTETVTETITSAETLQIGQQSMTQAGIIALALIIALLGMEPTRTVKS